MNRPEEAPYQAKGQQAKAIYGFNPDGSVKMPISDSGRAPIKRQGDSIHPIDYRALFNLLYFKKTTENDSWTPIPSGTPFALPIDYTCPHCNEMIHSEKTGSLRCSFCGATARPPTFGGHGKHAKEYTDEKRHRADLNRFIAAIKY